MLSEIWIYDHEISLYNLNNFDSYFCCRDSDKSGGICVYVKKHCNILNDCSYSMNTAESILLYNSQLDLNIVCLYRCLGFNIDSFNLELSNKLRNIKAKNVLLIGDLNIDILTSTSATDDYQNLLSSEGFTFLIDGITRDRSNSCIDHLILRSFDVSAESTIFKYNLTDHYPIACKLKFKASIHAKPEIIKISKVNYDKVNNFLRNYTFPLNLNSEDVNYLYDEFSTTLRNILTNFTRHVELTNRKTKNWIDEEILKMIKIKEKLYKKHKKYPFDVIYDQNYRNVQKELKVKIRNAKHNYFVSEFLKCNNIKKQWEFVNQITNSNKKDKKPVSSNVKLLADNINHFFVNMGSNSVCPEINNYKKYLTSQSNSFFLAETNDIETGRIVMLLDDKKSMGYDRITTKILKIVANYHISVITKIVNLSFLNGTFPTSLKTALVVPIHKSGDATEFANYRPISLLPIFSKVIEKIVHTRLYDYLKTFNIISNNQYGFLPGLSTEHALLEFTKYTYNSIDKNNKTTAIFLDISKAFDSVNHDILIDKLYSIGVRGIGLNWFISYLQNRKQLVKFGDTESNTLNIKSGVPQGSILGPLLFIIYINDFCKLNLNGKIITYADDTVILYSYSTYEILQNVINEDLLTIKDWFHANKLSINIKKTKFINFSIYGPSDNLFLYYHLVNCNNIGNIFCNCPPLQQVSSIKYLGLNVDYNLKWKSHVKYITNKLRYILHKFYFIKRVISRDFLLQLYHSWVNSIVSYGIAAWGGDYLENIKPIIKIQNKIIKFLSNYNQLPLFDLYKKLNILPVRHLFIFKIIILFTKQDNSYSLRNMGYGLRSQNLFLVPKAKKGILQKNYYYLSPKLFNNLPEHLKSEKSPFKFKKYLKSFILTIENVEVLL